MSHSVTITRTTTTSGGSGGIILNTGYIKTFPGLLKLAELILGAVCVGLIGYYITRASIPYGTEALFFLLMCVTFMIATFCLFISCLVSWSTGGIISKTIYELIYHSVAFLLLLISGIILLIEIQNTKWTYSYPKDEYLAASVIGIINAALYLISAFLANRQYRGI